jgi:hypothetical protein
VDAVNLVYKLERRISVNRNQVKRQKLTRRKRAWLGCSPHQRRIREAFKTRMRLGRVCSRRSARTVKEKREEKTDE